MERSGRVVVGVDGSDSSRMAAAWAATEAGTGKAEQVHVVAVIYDRSWDQEIRRLVEPLADRLAEQHPGLKVSSEVAHGEPADVLLRFSSDAELLVVGSRGRGTLAATLLGSVSAKVATHARCPVVVVRDHAGSGPVIVGLDNSRHSSAALKYAFDAASRYGCELVAVQVWQDVELAPVVPHLEHELIEMRDEVKRALSEQLAGWAESYPDVPVRRIPQRGHPVAELTAESEDARLLVVGHRGRGGFTGLLLGSVAAGVLQHAHCPVAVVRDG